MVCIPGRRKTDDDPSNDVLLKAVASLAWIISSVTMNDSSSIIKMKIKTAPGLEMHGKSV